MPISAANVYGSIGEMQRDYLYKLFSIDAPAAVSASFSNTTDFSANVDLYNTKAVFPNRKTNPIDIKWGGEFFKVPGVDESTRDTELEFFDDEPMWVYDFFSACKDLTGNEDNHAAVYRTDSGMNMAIAKVSVDKETITAYRLLKGVRVYSVETSNTDKSSSEVSKLKIGIHWDKNVEDKSKRNQKI